MKKIYHLLALVILGAFTFTSCDDFLDMQPTNSGNAEGAVGTVADAQVVINGVMSAMTCLLYTSPSPRDMRRSRMPSSA